MVPEDITTAEPEAPAVAEEPTSAEASTAADAEAEAEATAWFNEDPAEPAEETPETAETSAEEATPAPTTPPTATPAAEKSADKATPEAAPESEPDSSAPIVFDFQAAAQRVIADIPAKLTVGGKEVDVSAFVADFPEAPAVIANVASRIVEQAVAPWLPMLQEMQARQRHESFIQQVAAKVPDVRQVTASKEFFEWVGRQPKQLQEMASQNDVDSAVFVLNQYAAAKKPTALKLVPRQAAPAVNPAFEKKKATLASTLGGKTSARASGPDKNDYDAAFNED